MKSLLWNRIEFNPCLFLIGREDVIKFLLFKLIKLTNHIKAEFAFQSVFCESCISEVIGFQSSFRSISVIFQHLKYSIS